MSCQWRTHSCLHKPRRALESTGGLKWRTHSCVPQRHSCRCLWIAKVPSVGRSADRARRSACATRIHDHPIGLGRRFVAQETSRQESSFAVGDASVRQPEAATRAVDDPCGERLWRHKPWGKAPALEPIENRPQDEKSCPTPDFSTVVFQRLAARFVESVVAAHECVRHQQARPPSPDQREV